MRLLLQLAWRNIWRNKLRSIVVLISIAIGLFAGLAVLSLYKGMMTNRIRTVIDSETGHLQMHAPDFIREKEISMTMQQGDALLSKVEQLTQVKSVAPRVIALGMFATTTGSAGVQINGIEPDKEKNVSGLEKKIIAGKYFTKKKNEIIVGKKLADKLKIHVGSKIVLTFTDSANNLVSGAFKIAAIYQSVNAPLDERNVYVKKDVLSDLLGLNNSIHEIAILLKEDKATDAVHLQLQQVFPQ